MSEPRTRLPLGLLVATAFSGGAALLHETLWARSLAIVLGSTVQANAAIFAAFLVGLAVGAWIFGRKLPTRVDLGTAYALLEGGIAVTAFVVGIALHHYRLDLTTVVGSLGMGARLFAAFVVVLVMVLAPTILMGGTFPLQIELARRTAGRAESVYGLYALNTLGAAGGTLLASTVAIPSLGVIGSTVLAAGLNAWAALLVWPLRHELGAAASPAASTSTSTNAGSGPGPAVGGADARHYPPRWCLLLAAFTSGTIVLGIEVLWSRLASYFLGNRTLAFSVLLTWVLVLLAAGSWLAGKLVRWFKVNTTFFAWLFVAAAASIVLTSALASWWMRNQERVEALLPAPGQWLAVYRFLETGLLLAPLVVLGCVFPLSLLRTREAAVGTGVARLAGRFYLVNTAGSVLGSLGTGSLGVSSIGTFPMMACLVVACVVVAIAIAVSAAVGARSKKAFRPIVAALAVLAVLPVTMPPALSFIPPGKKLVFRTEDAYGVFQVLRNTDGTLTAMNDRTELVFRLGRIETSYVQQMQGHLGMIYCPEAKRAVVLGSGYGITAGALGLYPTLERVEAVEIVPGIVAAADLFDPFNFAYHKNPRVKVSLGDGRHYLARSTERFDIVSINVSDPHQPGGSSLFHEDFYDVVKEHLTPRGVVLQHAFGRDLGIVFATLRRSFPHVVLTRGYANGYNVVAATHELTVDRVRAEERLAAPAVAAALRSLGFITPLDPLRVLTEPIAMSSDELEAADAAVIASDNRPLLEFSFTGEPSSWFFSNE